MSAPILDATELRQAYAAREQMAAQRAQQMAQAAELQPLQVDQLRQNMLAKRMAMQDDQQRRNALMQYGASGSINALAMADPKLAAQMRMQETASNQRNALARENMQGRNALMQQQIAARSGAGRPPPGYRPTPDGNLEAIPGGPADLKQQGVLNQDTAALTGGINSFDRLATAANEALKHPGLAGITGLRGALPNIPGSDAADAQAKLNTLKSQVGFGVLQDMRNNSKTGGALGAVSDAEGKRLEANLAALENAQSETQMRDSLQKIVDYSAGAKDRLRGAYNLKHGDKAPAGTQTTAAPKGPAVGAVERGYRFKGGNPADQASWEKI